MEKYHIIDNVDEWHEIRKIRNNFTHEYPEDDKENVEQLNESFFKAKNILTIYCKTNAYVIENILKPYNVDIKDFQIKQDYIDELLL